MDQRKMFWIVAMFLALSYSQAALASDKSNYYYDNPYATPAYLDRYVSPGYGSVPNPWGDEDTALEEEARRAVQGGLPEGWEIPINGSGPYPDNCSGQSRDPLEDGYCDLPRY